MTDEKKISELTPEQEAKFPEYVEYGINLGLQTATIDREKGVEFAAEIQKFLDREHVGTVFTEGISDAWVATCILNTLGDKKDLPKDSPEDVKAVWEKIKDQVGKRSVKGTKTDLNAIQSEMKSFCMPEISQFTWTHWIAWYKYNKEVLELELDPMGPIERFTDFGAVYPLENGWVIISDRIMSTSMQDGELHNESGPAWEYRDGTKGYAINGVRVDEQVVMAPETQTLDQINNEENAEVKRIRIERYGWQKYLDEMNAKTIDFADNDIEGTKEALMECDDMMVLIGVCPSTGRVYAMEVDADCDTCEKARAYLSSDKSKAIIGAS